MRYHRIDNSSANGGKICPGPKIKKLHAESLCVKLDNHWHREFEGFDVDLGANIYDFSNLDAAQFNRRTRCKPRTDSSKITS
jgi:hypothetical protein